MPEKKRSYKIADTVITLDWSRSKILPDLKESRMTEGFICNKARRSDIHISIIYGYLPDIKKENVFKTGTDWRLSRSGKKYIYEKRDGMYSKGMSQLALFNESFTEGELFIESTTKRRKENQAQKKKRRLKKGKTYKREAGAEAEKKEKWDIGNIMTGFMQVLLLNFLAHNKKGILVHSSSLKYKGVSLTFLGKQNAGKSTMAELWSKAARSAEIFNDDRCVIKKDNGRFKIYSTPWPGSFSKYELAHKKADLGNVYFIYKTRFNWARRLPKVAAFSRIMQNIFPPFWSEDGMGFILSFCHSFAEEIDCYDLGFLKNKSIVSFLEDKIKEKAKENRKRPRNG